MNSKIAHIGGIFIYSEKPKELALWYQNHFGMEHETWGDSNVYYISFPYTDTANKSRYFAWSIMPYKKGQLPVRGGFTLNLRVNNLEELISQLAAQGIDVKPMETHPEGKFAWCNDADGNAIELWEDTAN